MSVLRECERNDVRLCSRIRVSDIGESISIEAMREGNVEEGRMEDGRIMRDGRMQLVAATTYPMCMGLQGS